MMEIVIIQTTCTTSQNRRHHYHTAPFRSSHTHHDQQDLNCRVSSNWFHKTCLCEYSDNAFHASNATSSNLETP